MWYIRDMAEDASKPDIKFLDGDDPVLIWQYDNARNWEGDWIRELLPVAAKRAHFDFRHHRLLARNMYVVENKLNGDHTGYYEEASRRGCNVVLLHFGDGAFRENRDAYAHCVQVWRHHWSAEMAAMPTVRYLPLGFKAGFARPGGTTPAAGRPHLWGFAGDVNKTTRKAMLDAMRVLGPGAEHLTDRWLSPDALPVQGYRAFMDSIVFAPCPKGFVSPDSFRLFEALEAGCIPIVERKGPGLPDYYAAAFGPHPIPTIDDWREAPALIRAIQDGGETEALRLSCAAWWQEYRLRVRDEISAALPPHP